MFKKSLKSNLNFKSIIIITQYKTTQIFKRNFTLNITLNDIKLYIKLYIRNGRKKCCHGH